MKLTTPTTDLPNDVWRHIYTFDMTFKRQYDIVMMELHLIWFYVNLLEEFHEEFGDFGDVVNLNFIDFGF